MAIWMKIYGTTKDGYHVVATVPGVRNPSGQPSAWTIDTAPQGATWSGKFDNGEPVIAMDESVLQSALNRLASKVQASKPFPKW